MERERFWTLPNVVSLSRLGLAAAFALTQSVAWRLALVGIASSSDVVDGWLARRRAGASRWGNLIDPVCDRAFAVTAITTLALEGIVSPLEVFVFLSRDIATMLGFGLAQLVRRLRGVKFVSRFPGKVVTVLQFLALVAAIAAPAHTAALVIVLAVASGIAIADYSWTLFRSRAMPAS